VFLLVLMILLTWVLTSILTGVSLGAIIRRGEQIHKDELLSCLFESTAIWQASNYPS